MNKFLKWTLIVIVSLAVLLFIAYQYLIYQTKQGSPEEIVNYENGDRKITVFYNRPSKKERVIFGELVPYGKVWRTGANEASTFETNQDLQIGGQTLAAGKYTLWTIPNADKWTVIFNSKMYSWGINFDQTSPREPEADVLKVDVPVEKTSSTVEMFTISMKDGAPTAMVLEWDDVRVSVPIE